MAPIGQDLQAAQLREDPAEERRSKRQLLQRAREFQEALQLQKRDWESNRQIALSIQNILEHTVSKIQGHLDPRDTAVALLFTANNLKSSLEQLGRMSPCVENPVDGSVDGLTGLIPRRLNGALGGFGRGIGAEDPEVVSSIPWTRKTEAETVNLSHSKEVSSPLRTLVAAWRGAFRRELSPDSKLRSPLQSNVDAPTILGNLLATVE